jgi:hypothetical protein
MFLMLFCEEDNICGWRVPFRLINLLLEFLHCDRCDGGTGVPTGIRAADTEPGFVLGRLDEAAEALGGDRRNQRAQAVSGDSDQVGRKYNLDF